MSNCYFFTNQPFKLFHVETKQYIGYNVQQTGQVPYQLYGPNQSVFVMLQDNNSTTSTQVDLTRSDLYLFDVTESIKNNDPNITYYTVDVDVTNNSCLVVDINTQSTNIPQITDWKGTPYNAGPGIPYFACPVTNIGLSYVDNNQTIISNVADSLDAKQFWPSQFKAIPLNYNQVPSQGFAPMTAWQCNRTSNNVCQNVSNTIGVASAWSVWPGADADDCSEVLFNGRYIYNTNSDCQTSCPGTPMPPTPSKSIKTGIWVGIGITILVTLIGLMIYLWIRYKRRTRFAF